MTSPHSYTFPAGFQFGVATAAYQIEGAITAGGRLPSVWDTFSATPGRVNTGETGAVACDHYHRFEADLDLLVALGIKHYRLSLSWARLIPNGTGPLNPAAVDFYRRLLSGCRDRGITPHVTLFHWDSPQALEDRYGSWRSRQMAYDFQAYVAQTVKALGDLVTHWMTINEIMCFTQLGYGVGRPGSHAPGTAVGSWKEVNQTIYHAVLAHGLAVDAIREHSPQPCRIAVVDNLAVPVPVTESPENIAAAGRALGDLSTNGNILYPLLTGDFSPSFRTSRGPKGELPDITDSDLAIMSRPLDAFGLNIYSGFYVRAADNAAGYEALELPAAYPRLNMPWLNLVPDALYWGVRHVQETLGFAGSIFIAENGCAVQDTINEKGEVMDLDRILYLRSYLRQAHRATAEGRNLTGYFLWSFLDNFEWAWGYSKRFGIVYTNYETQARLPKASAHWYAECIRQHRVV